MPQVNKNVTDHINEIICDDCREKIIEMTSKLSKIDIAFPFRLLSKYQRSLCYDCHKKVVKYLKENQHG